MKNMPSRPRKALAATAVGAVALAGALTFAAPAQAAEKIENFNGCTLARGLVPRHSGFDNRGDKTFGYPVRITCKADREVRFMQEAYEKDPGADELQGQQSSGWFTFNQLEMKRFDLNLSLKTPQESDQQIYHRIRIQVRSHEVTSPWSSWANSATLNNVNN